MTSPLEQLKSRDDAYSEHAYRHAIDSLMMAVEESVHVSPKEYLDVLLRHAHNEFGRLAPFVFKQWNISHVSQWFFVLRQMEEVGALKLNESDTFDSFYDCSELTDHAFDEMFAGHEFAHVAEQPATQTSTISADLFTIGGDLSNVQASPDFANYIAGLIFPRKEGEEEGGSEQGEQEKK